MLPLGACTCICRQVMRRWTLSPLWASNSVRPCTTLICTVQGLLVGTGAGVASAAPGRARKMLFGLVFSSGTGTRREAGRSGFGPSGVGSNFAGATAGEGAGGSALPGEDGTGTGGWARGGGGACPVAGGGTRD